MTIKKIYIGSLGGSSSNMKANIIEQFSNDYEFIDMNTVGDLEMSAAKKVGFAVVKDLDSRGIVRCGNGFGVSKDASVSDDITVINCVNVSQVKSGRLINDARVLALGARMVTGDVAIDLVKSFLEL